MQPPLKISHDADFARLSRLKFFSWLSASELKQLIASIRIANYKRGEVIFRESAFGDKARILIGGVARITCLNSSNARVTVALIPPGPIAQLQSSPSSRFDFRCEAYNNCRVGALDWQAFQSIGPNGRELAVIKFYEHNLKHWYRLLRRTSLFHPDLHRRIANALLDLCDDFGIQDSRGTLLTLALSHKDIAGIVGASRPRVTEHLAQLERAHLLCRQGRRLIISAGNLSRSLATVHAA